MPSDASFVYDPYVPQFQQHSHAVYRRLRDDYPVYHNEERGFWAIQHEQERDQSEEVTQDPAIRWRPEGLNHPRAECDQKARPDTPRMDPITHGGSVFDQCRSCQRFSLKERRLWQRSLAKGLVGRATSLQSSGWLDQRSVRAQEGRFGAYLSERLV